jgi:hypothetical protein
MQVNCDQNFFRKLENWKWSCIGVCFKDKLTSKQLGRWQHPSSSLRMEVDSAIIFRPNNILASKFRLPQIERCCNSQQKCVKN